MARRKPTRRDLLVVIGRLQDLTGRALGAYRNDRDPDRAKHVAEPLETAVDLCVAATEQDRIVNSGPWSEQ